MLEGSADMPVVAAVGVWDPLLPDHLQLLSELGAHSRRHGLCSVAIVIDPPPSVLVRGAASWPIYSDVLARIRILRESCGLDAVAQMRFTRESLQATAADFFRVVGATIVLGELWLGAYQDIGTGAESSPESVERLARQHGVRLRRLPETEVSLSANEVRHLLAEGRVAEAARTVGQPPVRSRPADGPVRLAWRPGSYRAAELKGPSERTGGITIPVELVADGDGESLFEWPNPRIEYLAFLSGPGDRA